MKAAVFHKFRDIRYEEVEDITLTEGDSFDVLIKVKAAGICGSDISHYIGQHTEELPDGSIMGHEFSGEVIEIGSNVSNVKVGDLVGVEPLLGCGQCGYCKQGDYYLCENLRHIGYYYSGGFAEYVKVPHEKVCKLPENVTCEEAATLDCYAVAVHGLRRVPVSIGDTVVVFGGGPVGLCMAQVAKAAGGKVIIIDIVEGVLDICRKAGFSEVYNSMKEDVVRIVKEMTNGRGADVVFDGAGGNAPVLETAVKIIRPRGTLGIIGMRGSLELDSVAAHFKEIDIKYIFSYSMWNYQTEFAMALEMIKNGKVVPRDIITHYYPLSKVEEAFSVALNKKESNAVKVMLLPQEQ